MSRSVTKLDVTDDWNGERRLVRQATYEIGSGDLPDPFLLVCRCGYFTATSVCTTCGGLLKNGPAS